MGKIEEKVKKNCRRANLQHIILGTVKTAGLLSVAVMAPNAIQVLEQIDPGYRKRKRNPKYALNRSFQNLLEKGLIEIEHTRKGKYVRLTQRGERALHELDLSKIHQLQSKKKWDKKWRVIIFDIPEERKVLRNKLRFTLQEIGFYMLQQSVWVYPYDCENLITMIKADFKIGKDVLYIVADQIENDKIVRAHFKL